MGRSAFLLSNALADFNSFYESGKQVCRKEMILFYLFYQSGKQAFSVSFFAFE